MDPEEQKARREEDERELEAEKRRLHYNDCLGTTTFPHHHRSKNRNNRLVRRTLDGKFLAIEVRGDCKQFSRRKNMSLNYTDALAQQQQRDQDAELERSNETEWGKILAEYPLVNHSANSKEVYEWCRGSDHAR